MWVFNIFVTEKIVCIFFSSYVPVNTEDILNNYRKVYVRAS